MFDVSVLVGPLPAAGMWKGAVQFSFLAYDLQTFVCAMPVNSPPDWHQHSHGWSPPLCLPHSSFSSSSVVMYLLICNGLSYIQILPQLQVFSIIVVLSLSLYCNFQLVCPHKERKNEECLHTSAVPICKSRCGAHAISHIDTIIPKLGPRGHR